MGRARMRQRITFNIMKTRARDEKGAGLLAFGAAGVKSAEITGPFFGSLIMVQPGDLVVLEIPYRDPAAAFQPLANQPFAQLLFSAPGASGAPADAGAPVVAGGGRYSFIVADPYETLVARGARIETRGGAAAGNPFEALRAQLNAAPLPSVPGLPPFQGGAVGFFGYELLHHLEDMPDPVRQDPEAPDMAFGFYDCLAAFDGQKQKAYALAWPRAGGRAEAAIRAQRLAERLGAGAAPPLRAVPPPPAPRSNLTRAEYEAMAARVITHIFDGDIYQANISQNFTTEIASPAHAYDVFRRLSALSPVSYGAYMSFPGLTLASNSPERFVRLSDPRGARRVQTRPIKGTASRGADAQEDAAQALALQSSEKDRAENIMIVDLMRNDLSKVCEDASVKVTGLCEVESYTAIHHLVSTVTGVLRPGRHAVDLVTACFPGGSITGAPKVRAMEIIAGQERAPRGAYCGAIGYLGFDGAMDTNIAIRTLSFMPISGSDAMDLTFRVGGAVTARSDPAAEYEESMAKAAAFFKALAAPPC